MIPDSLPILTSGLGDAAAGRACAMSAVHWMEGGNGNSDMPECVHPVISRAFIRINDAGFWESDEQRTRTLWPLIARAMGTAPTGMVLERHVLLVRLAVAAARHVLPLVRPQDQQVCETAILTAGHWCDTPTAAATATAALADAAYAAASAAYDATAYDATTTAYAAAAYAAAAYAAASAAYDAASDAYDAAAYAAASAAYNATAYAAASAAAAAYDATATAAFADPAAASAFLSALLDEHDVRTGRATPPPLNLRGLDQLVPTLR